MHSDLTYDVSPAHRRSCGDKPKKDIFLLVTTRLIVHSRQSEFFPNCVGEFGIDSIALGDQQRNVKLPA